MQKSISPKGISKSCKAQMENKARKAHTDQELVEKWLQRLLARGGMSLDSGVKAQAEFLASIK